MFWNWRSIRAIHYAVLKEAPTSHFLLVAGKLMKCCPNLFISEILSFYLMISYGRMISIIIKSHDSMNSVLNGCQRHWYFNFLFMFFFLRCLLSEPWLNSHECNVFHLCHFLVIAVHVPQSRRNLTQDFTSVIPSYTCLKSDVISALIVLSLQMTVPEEFRVFSSLIK